ncbi:hypothetical protein FEM48_Zijuj05G0087400 [Ziziphus jujuba var. spinosa]|uniref:RING-type E3 ubiquitin transferase n=1 Tax=Ziziphus jujuba var. spinosa TaxID=714518 RepID=A0A978VDZ4_ZIZJJ|nr:hypothetical protein FEM48_Zijuj05G0087400 [Ziziphus jujuba var. spinosa]
MRVVIEMVMYCIGLLLLLMMMMTIVVADIGLGAARKECSESRYYTENGPPIRFPFRLKHKHPDSCGYPGFSVSCTSSNHTALELSIDSIRINFLIRKIDYKSQALHIYDLNHCYEKLFSNHPSIPHFQLISRYAYNYTLFNCSSLLELTYSQQISCSGDSRYQIYLVDSGYYINYHRFFLSCTKLYDLPGYLDEKSSQLVNDIQLKWSKPKCGACEAKCQTCGTVEWIYNLLEEGEDLRIHIDDEGDAKVAKKLAIVGLWCIQWHLGDCLSMKTVYKKEGVDKLTMPRNPFASTGTKRMNTHMPKATTNMKQELEMIHE